MGGSTNGGIHEFKFPLPPEAVNAVIAWMRRGLRPDPHGAGEHGDQYLVQSVYLDTSAFDVFHRRASFGRAKFRIRRYGDGAWVFLERKLKRGGVVRKRRLAVPSEELERLNVEANGSGWDGAWFHHRIALRGLQPVVRMSYHRLARWDASPEGDLRVTLDRQLLAVRATDFTPPGPLMGDDLLGGGAVLEVKFENTLPQTVKTLVEDLKLVTGPLSKYRLGVRACGLVAPSTEPEGDTPSSESLHA